MRLCEKTRTLEILQPCHLRAQTHPNKLLRLSAKLYSFRAKHLVRAILNVWLRWNTQALEGGDYHNGQFSVDLTTGLESHLLFTSLSSRKEEREKEQYQEKGSTTNEVSKKSHRVPNLTKVKFSDWISSHMSEKYFSILKGKISAIHGNNACSLCNLLCAKHYAKQFIDTWPWIYMGVFHFMDEKPRHREGGWVVHEQ